MAEVSKVAPPLSLARRITGIILVVLGGGLWADTGWWGAFHGLEMDAFDWMKFGFWLWLGAMLFLVGIGVRIARRDSGTLKIVKEILGWLAFLFLIATPIKALLNLQMKPGDPRPCSSSAAAKIKGVWVCDYSVEPNVFHSDGKTLRLGEAWVEEMVDDGYLVWFRRHLGWNRLCLRIPRRGDGVVGLDHFMADAAYAGEDLIYVKNLRPGESIKVESLVVFREWETKLETKLGTTVVGALR